MSLVDQEILKKADKIQKLLIAFSPRDVQVVHTVLAWLESNDITANDFQEFMTVWYEINRLQTLGYFRSYSDHDGAKYVRELERAVKNRKVRHYIRTMRLNTTRFNSPFSVEGG